ncbi:tyrosine-type recombinase/integrase [Salinicoccus jeotgali]|uniref:Tyrosine-type recombinase/integrase n=1 Tax=Salinicoccus jeotgali TaxID=381634 RepID=A0ABP7ERL2_9STAP
MPIYKDESRKTYYVSLSYMDKFGERRYHKKRGFRRRKDARTYEDDFFISLDEGAIKDALPFTHLSNDYLEWYADRRKPSSIKTMKNYINNHLDPYFRNIDVYNMTTKDILDFHKHMQEKEFRGKKLSKGYVQDIHTALSSILSHGMKFYDLKSNVAALAGNIENDEDYTWNYWTVAEFEHFYSVIEDLRYRAYFRLLYFSGVRHGEQRALTWRDINFQEGYINIDKTNYNGQVHKPKTKTSKRKVYIPGHVIEVLQEYKAWYQENQPYKEDYVVFGSFYQSIGETTVGKKYDALVKQTDIKRIKIHEFRHSHASDCINRLGMDRETLAKRLGHASSVTIEKVYGHLYPSTEKDAISGL